MATTHRAPVTDPTSSLVISHPADSASICFQLVDTRSLKLISSKLREAPPYIAISHVWTEALFPVAQKHDIGNTIGYQIVLAALRETSPKINHLWVDTWCIDQHDDKDKHRQMPLMGQIYRTAEFVLVTLGHNLNHTQSDLDDMMSKLSKVQEMMESGKTRRAESFEYLGSAEVVEPLLRGFAFLRSLMQSSWPTRIWCFQEAALAKKVLWIGLNRVSLHVSDKTLVAIILIAVTNRKLSLEFGADLKSALHLMIPLINHRLGRTDPTCVMEAAYQRNSTFPEDQIYGLMGASGVIIGPDPNKSLEMLWREWLKKAIGLGHIRWLMLSWNSGYPNFNRDIEYARSGCVVPPFRERTTARMRSEVHNCRPYGSIGVSEDCIKVPGYCVGTCSSFVLLGSAANVSDLQECVMTLACLGRGDLELTMRIVAAMWYTNGPESLIQPISELICSEYRSGVKNMEDGMNARPFYESIGWQGRDMINNLGLWLQDTYGMELYLTTIESEMKKSEVIMTAVEPIAPGNFLALGLITNHNRGLKSGLQDLESSVLMIVQTVPEATTGTQTASREPIPYLHKVGLTLPVLFAKTAERATAHLAHTWDESPLKDFVLPLSSVCCPVCQVQAMTAVDIRQWIGDLHENGVEEIFQKDMEVEYQRRFGRGQVEFLPDVKNRAIIDKVFYRRRNGGYSERKNEIQTNLA